MTSMIIVALILENAKSPGRQQRFVVDGIKRVVCQARERGFAVAADDDYGCAAVASRFCHAIQSARFAGV